MRPKSSYSQWLIVCLTSFSLGSGLAILVRFSQLISDSLLPNSSIISDYRRPGSITIVSSKGKVIQKIGPTTRVKIEPSLIPLSIKQAFIAAEDRRFYNHNGVDLWGIGRATLNNFKEGMVAEGGSTITQQLARIIFLNQEKSFSRKIKEAALAYKLERQLHKEEILGNYLNTVYLGSGAYGVADAAWIYFSKSPSLLTLSEIALISGLPPAPSLYSPLVNPDLAIQRRSIVLNRMLRENFISKEQFEIAINSPLNLKPAKLKYTTSSAPFFTSWLNQQLPNVLTKEQIEIGGLKIISSLNLDWQKKAQALLKDQTPDRIEGAIVAIEPDNGLVRVLVGGKDFSSNQFNRATQAIRSPGSTFKIFPYAAAIESGISTSEEFIDKPKCWKGYCPKNFGRKYFGKISLKDAFKYSSNTVAVELLERVGFTKVISTANNLGIGNTRKLGKYYPLALGAYGQTVIDMTTAYAVIANKGIYHSPTPFEEIRGPKNKVIWEFESNKKGSRVLKPATAKEMTMLLKESVKNGTGRAAYLKGINVAGKTGTSDDEKDLWFIGSIPNLTTGVWLGFDNNSKTNLSSGDAANIWKTFISKISKVRNP